MDPKFSTIVKNIISSSREECLRLDMNYISEEHFFLGMLKEWREQKNQVSAINILYNLDVDLSEVKNKIEKLLKPEKKGKKNLGNIPLTKKAEKILKITYLEAKISKSSKIGSIHLLLSILREEDNDLCTILKEYNINYEVINENFNFSNDFEIEDSRSVEEVVSIDITENVIHTQEPLSLIFNLEEFSQEEIKEVIVNFSNLYNSISGDNLTIVGSARFDIISHLDCA